MHKSILIAIFCFLVSYSFAFAATVDVRSEIFESSTIFTYEFKFDETDNYRSFSFEKPRDAVITEITDTSASRVRYSIAGDYFIIQPEEVSGRNFTVKFSSQAVSSEIMQTGKYSVYVNFNFPVSRLVYEVEMNNRIPAPLNFFPRGYQTTDDGNYVWTINNVESDTLFFIEFENSNGGFTPISPWRMNLLIIIGTIIAVGFALIFAISVFFWGKKKKNERVNIDNIEVGQKPQANQQITQIVKKEESSALKKETFEEIIDKYLTENEKEVVKIVESHPGISQYDILNYAPRLTKSNLSKIITKLNGKKILSRIRVGKINKIYLGEKLEGSQKE